MHASGEHILDEETSDTPFSRRRVISSAGVGMLGLGGSLVLGGLATRRLMFPNVVNEPDPTISVGKLSRYSALPIGAVSETFREQGVWIIRLAGGIAALSTRCTHLGCLTHWVAGERKFRCPCHGSVFAPDGSNLAGPAPRALDLLRIWRVGDELFVDRGKVYRRGTGRGGEIVAEIIVSC